MKTDRSTLKAMFIRNGGFRGRKVPTPEGLLDWQWTKLQKHWTSDGAQKKSEQMSNAQKNIKNPSLVGRGGFAPVVSELVRVIDLCMICLYSFLCWVHFGIDL